MQTVTVTLVVKGEGDSAVEARLGHTMIELIAERVDDHPSQSILVDLLAQHPSARVRRAVACRNCLSEERIAALADDPDVEVRRALLSSSSFRNWVTTERLLTMAAANVDVAVQVAGDVHVFDVAEVDRLAEELAVHPDPSVRAALAQGWRTPKRVLKQLLEDPDYEVGLSAKETLDQR